MVTSWEMMETEMGYRGSKSNKDKTLFVKEQRVDGSYIGTWKIFPILRCILMGLKRDYPNKVLSKSLNRYYSTSIIHTDTSQIFESKLVACALILLVVL